jgi:hypothetical protein
MNLKDRLGPPPKNDDGRELINKMPKPCPYRMVVDAHKLDRKLPDWELK